MFNFRWLIFLFLALPAWALASPASELTALLNRSQGIRAKFTQQVYHDTGKETYQGNLVILRPGRFRWQVEKPSRQLIVADGKNLWIYDEDLEQVTIEPLAETLGQTPAMLLSGNITDLSKQYDVFFHRLKNQSVYVLNAKAKEGMIQSLKLTFNGEKIAKIVLTDGLAHQTELSFQEVAINPPIDVTLFHFKPPAGVDVIGNKP